jgi:hypothetical protein
MPDTSTTFEYSDPRQLEGDPFQVASAAADQTVSALEVSIRGVDDLFIMARGAHMERQLQNDEEPDGASFGDDALGFRIKSARAAVQTAVKTIKGVGIAASYNPRKPPKELPNG